MAMMTPTKETADMPVKTDGQPRPARWDPFDVFENVQEEMARLWAQNWPFRFGGMDRPLHRVMPAAAAWAPRIDVFEKDGARVVKAELPGIKKEDIQVSLADGDLVIRGERKTESEAKEEDYYRCERSYGSFYRRLPLPFEASADKIEARFADGVLEVRIPRPAEQKPPAQHIPVS
jgi:HSP20 family protein